MVRQRRVVRESTMAEETESSEDNDSSKLWWRRRFSFEVGGRVLPEASRRDMRREREKGESKERGKGEPRKRESRDRVAKRAGLY